MSAAQLIWPSYPLLSASCCWPCDSLRWMWNMTPASFASRLSRSKVSRSHEKSPLGPTRGCTNPSRGHR